VALAGIGCYMVGLALLAFAPTLEPSLVGLAFCGLGSGAFSPCASALASKQAAPHERGAVLGTYQSAASLARIIGPLASGPLYQHVAVAAPFVAGLAVLAPAALLIGALRRYGFEA
jgi:DHA1 family tetracycline resistance protein-like MFS transporter